ncbi:ABC transporter substrate-binding protein [Martelella radicis]|uniref:sn-glycerol 3-phosphate transport system substrate-binding protein n=1 Tax=Martelella radicis TaxID=1397476 RepID=A0A7W6KLL0_9HYPH|nr:ABC transporter substrate-binding protein [Martelella radicis]MBB4123315.1 sn-glycerol 3-phosphate transport system substrate-binding protein [Martelella radicis]
MMKLSAYLLAGSVALSASAAFAADTTVEFWHSFSDTSANGAALAEIIDNFEAANPGITIDSQFIGNYNDIVAKLQAAIPARRAPDAVIMEVTRYGLFADRGVLDDLSDRLANDPLADNLFDFAREVGVYEGKNYIVPFNSSTPVLYLNKAVFDAAGFEEEPKLETYDDILAAAQQITDSLGDEGIMGMTAPGQFARWGLIMSNDSDLIDSKTGEILIDAPNTVDAYEWMASLVNDYKVASPDGVTDEKKDKQFFMSGNAGMMMNSTGNYGDAKEALGDDLLVRPMPCNKTCAVPIGGAGIGILSSAEPEVKDAAYKFISFAASPESNAIWFAGTGYMPINRHTAEQPRAAEALANAEGIDVAINQLDFARGRPRPVVVTWMRANEYDVWQSIALGQRSAEEALSDFAERTRQEAQRLSN